MHDLNRGYLFSLAETAGRKRDSLAFDELINCDSYDQTSGRGTQGCVPVCSVAKTPPEWIPQSGRIVMAGMFELFIDAESYFRFRLTAPDGTVMAVSKAFDDKAAAVAGIAAVREYAGMGLIADVSPTERRATPPEVRDVTVQVREVRRIPAADLHARSREIHRAPSGSRWAGAV